MDRLAVLPFTLELSQREPLDFARSVLAELARQAREAGRCLQAQPHGAAGVAETADILLQGRKQALRLQSQWS